MLMALDAEVVAAGSQGERLIPLDQFFLDYYETALAEGEVLVKLRLPPLPALSRAIYLKYLPRTEDDYATVAIGAWLQQDEDGRCTNLRVALGAAGSTPLRATRVEMAMRGERLTPRLVEEAAELVRDEVDPIDDMRGRPNYKREMARVWVARALGRLLRDE